MSNSNATFEGVFLIINVPLCLFISLNSVDAGELLFHLSDGRRQCGTRASLGTLTAFVADEGLLQRCPVRVLQVYVGRPFACHDHLLFIKVSFTYVDVAEALEEFRQFKDGRVLAALVRAETDLHDMC